MTDAAIFVWILFIAHIILAVLYTFFGYKMFRGLISVYMFLFVFPLVFNALAGSTSLSTSVAILIAVGVAALATALTWAIYKVAIFVCGGSLGAAIAIAIFQTGLSLTACICIAVILFIVFGIVALKFKKVLIIISSSVVGAFSLFVYGYYILFSFAAISTMSFDKASKLFLTFSDIIGSHYLLYLIPIAIAIIGIIFQAHSAPSKQSGKSSHKQRYNEDYR